MNILIKYNLLNIKTMLMKSCQFSKYPPNVAAPRRSKAPGVSSMRAIIFTAMRSGNDLGTQIPLFLSVLKGARRNTSFNENCIIN